MDSNVQVEGSSDKRSSRPRGLPEVSDEAAQAAREQVAQRTFVPSTHRPPDEVLPNPEFIRILDQGQEGVSVGVALAAVLNYLRAERAERKLVSPRMLYEYARVYDEWRDADHEGSSLLGGLAGLTRHGVCLDIEWPLYDPHAGPDAAALDAALANRPAAVLRIDKSVDHLRAAVFEHHALVVAAEVHKGWSGAAARRDPIQRQAPGEGDDAGKPRLRPGGLYRRRLHRPEFVGYGMGRCRAAGSTPAWDRHLDLRRRDGSSCGCLGDPAVTPSLPRAAGWLRRG